MKVQRWHPVGLAVLSALALLSINVGASTTMGSSGGCMDTNISDGYCDEANNNEECGYDGGDCCSCTCVSTTDFACGEDFDFVCLDPSASCFDDGSVPSSCDSNTFSDGDCDLFNNSEECGYDGGDCCECTCVSTSFFTCGDRSHGIFACLDPSAPCVDDDDVTTLPESERFSDDSATATIPGCIPGSISDGYCDNDNNVEACGYDGGDCCECTCVSTEYYTCGDESIGGYACLDPGASCVDDDDITTLPGSDDSQMTSTIPPCFTNLFSDGFCDGPNNTEECGYDGGDCCECTCVSTDSHLCDNGDDDDSVFSCIDPSAPCVNDDDYSEPEDDSYFGDDNGDFSASFEFGPCIEAFIGDGDCDSINNIEQCDFDGGDCCECDCVNTSVFGCDTDGLNCLDPSSPCVTGYVDAGTKTTVDVSANGYDTRAGISGADVGCQENGCTPALTRDGVTADVESRWSCAQSIVDDGSLCEIKFLFEDPQDIVDVEAAFWKGDERSRSLEVKINDEVIGQFDSSPRSTFTAFGIKAAGVSTLTLTTVGLDETEWISLLEVLFLVEP